MKTASLVATGGSGIINRTNTAINGGSFGYCKD